MTTANPAVASPIGVRPDGTQSGSAGILPAAAQIQLVTQTSSPRPAPIGGATVSLTGVTAPNPQAAHITLVQLLFEILGAALMTFFAGESDGAGTLMLIVVVGFWVLWMIHHFSTP